MWSPPSSYTYDYYEGGPQAADFRGMRARPFGFTTVRLSNGEEVGFIEELVISDAGFVDYMIVSCTAMPGLEGRLAALPWGAARMDFRARVATLEMDRDRFYQSPVFYAHGTFPDLYEGGWAARVHSHFGLDSSRIERAYRAPEPQSPRERDMIREPGRQLDRPAQPPGEQRGILPRETTPAPSPGQTKPDEPRKDTLTPPAFPERRTDQTPAPSSEGQKSRTDDPLRTDEEKREPQ